MFLWKHRNKLEFSSNSSFFEQIVEISWNVTKVREISYQVTLVDFLEKCPLYNTKNHYIGCKRYMEKEMYISVTSYIYSVWGPYFEPSARNLCCGGLCAQLPRQVAANPVQTTTTTNNDKKSVKRPTGPRCREARIAAISQERGDSLGRQL